MGIIPYPTEPFVLYLPVSLSLRLFPFGIMISPLRCHSAIIDDVSGYAAHPAFDQRTHLDSCRQIKASEATYWFRSERPEQTRRQGLFTFPFAFHEKITNRWHRNQEEAACFHRKDGMAKKLIKLLIGLKWDVLACRAKGINVWLYGDVWHLGFVQEAEWWFCEWMLRVPSHA